MLFRPAWSKEPSMTRVHRGIGWQGRAPGAIEIFMSETFRGLSGQMWGQEEDGGEAKPRCGIKIRTEDAPMTVPKC